MLTFFVIVLAIYVTECVYRVESGGIVLTGARRGRWRARLGPMLTLGGKGGVSVAPLLPPLPTQASFGQPSSAIDAGTSLSKEAQKRAAARVQEFFDAAAPVWIACNALWLFVCIVAPAIVFRLGLAATWPELLIAGLTILAFLLVTFWWAHRTLYPNGVAERRSRTILMGVSPLGAIRAVDHLSGRLLAGVHPVVAAMVLCPRDETVRLARWLYFVPDRRDDGLRRLLESGGLWSDVVAPPGSGEAGTTAFCPRCHAQYIRPEGTCSDCAGIELVKWAEPV